MAAASAIQQGGTDAGIVQQVGHRYYGNRRYGYRNYGYRNYGHPGTTVIGITATATTGYGYGRRPDGYYRPYGYYGGDTVTPISVSVSAFGSVSNAALAKTYAFSAFPFDDLAPSAGVLLAGISSGGRAAAPELRLL